MSFSSNAPEINLRITIKKQDLKTAVGRFVEFLMQSSWPYSSIEVNSFSVWICQSGVPSKDPTVWLYGARPTNYCIPPSFLQNVPAQLRSVPTPKNTFASQRFSLRILLFGYMELDLPTIVSHPSSWGTCLHNCAVYPPPKNTFASPRFSLRILLFGYMELDLPTIVSHPSSWGTCLHNCVVYPPQKIHLPVRCSH